MADSCPRCGWPPCRAENPGSGTRCIRPKDHRGDHHGILGQVWSAIPRGLRSFDMNSVTTARIDGSEGSDG